MTPEDVTKSHVEGLREAVGTHRRALETGNYSGSSFGVTRADVPKLLAELDVTENELRSKIAARERIIAIIEAAP